MYTGCISTDSAPNPFPLQNTTPQAMSQTPTWQCKRVKDSHSPNPFVSSENSHALPLSYHWGRLTSSRQITSYYPNPNCSNAQLSPTHTSPCNHNISIMENNREKTAHTKVIICTCPDLQTAQGSDSQLIYCTQNIFMEAVGNTRDLCSFTY